MDVIASTNNIYIDTSRALANTSSVGDNFQINLGALTLQANENQMLRMVLLEFNMYKVFTDVNANNFAFQMFSSFSPATGTALGIVQQNYSTVHDLAVAFANALGAYMVLATPGTTTFQVSNLLPGSTAGITGTTNNIISFEVQAGNGTAPFVPVVSIITGPVLQAFEELGDFAQLIGGDRISTPPPPSPPTTQPTVSATMGGGLFNPLVIQCFYPAQRSTTPYIYVRTNLETASLETSSLDRPSGQDLIQEVLGANILARVPVNTEFCNYSINTENVYYLNLTQKSVSTLRLYLTDESNRPIGRRYGSNQRTASGNFPNQSNLGNLTFSAVFRIDLVQIRPKGDMLFPTPPVKINEKMSNVMISPRPPL